MAKMDIGKVLLFQRIAPHYRIPVFNRLKHELDIHVCFSSEKKGALIASATKVDTIPGERIWRTYFLNKETCVIQNVIKPLLRYRPKIVISEFSIAYLSFWALFFLKFIFRFKLLAWSHGINNHEVHNPFKSWQSKVFLSILPHIDGLILYSHLRKTLIEEKVGKNAKLFVAQNTIETDVLLKQQITLKARGKKAIQSELNFTEQYHLIYIGRLVKDKRIDLIVEVFIALLSKFDIALHIIGSGPELKYIEQNLHLTGLYYHGAIYDDEINGKYLFASDIVLNPGYVGLSIVHGFALGKPLVTCESTASGPNHSPEIEYLESGVNGMTCENSVDSLVNAVTLILKDNELLAKLSNGALETAIKKCSLENMIAGFRDAINTVSAER
ncbi:glycosyltransferase [candidate division KSB1 bacterium]|nr:glycosyltransferase [candidate division KSB1 bacterium]